MQLLGAGDAGLAEREYRKHELHHGTGVGSNTGAYGDNATSTGTTDTSRHHHLGPDTAVRAGGIGLAEHEYRKHGREGGFGNTTGTHADEIATTGTGTSSHHHLGRDATHWCRRHRSCRA